LSNKRGKKELIEYLDGDPEILKDFLSHALKLGNLEYFMGFLAIPEFKVVFYDVYSEKAIEGNAFNIVMEAASYIKPNQWAIVRKILDNIPDTLQWPINAIVGDERETDEYDIDCNESHSEDDEDGVDPESEIVLTAEPTRADVDRIVKKQAIGRRVRKTIKKEKYKKAKVSDREHDTLLALAVKSRVADNVEYILKKFGPRLQERPLMFHYETEFYRGAQRWDFSIHEICAEVKMSSITALIQAHFNKT